jgi:DNA-binding beta-propeller fold protein YncE
MRALCLLTIAACAAEPSTGTVIENATVPTPGNNYTLFETLQTRPLALSPNGQLLFACNTPDNRLEIYKIMPSGLKSVGSVTVGLEPISIAVRNQNEVWVVNHLSDSVSIVKVDAGASSHVVRTLLVGDEPRDIVFAHDRAFITTAHRGQNTGDDPGLFDPSQGRADVWVFDANNLGASAGGNRVGKLTLFADSPRALAVSADGNTVYAAPFFSGNQTTSVSVDAVRAVHPEWLLTPNVIKWPESPYPQPLTGLVVKYTNGHWLDVYGGNYDAWVRVSLPDYDVFAIDTNTLTQTKAIAHVGTTLFNMAVNPATGKVFVTNTEAHNDVRFEGPSPGSVRGQIVDSRISVVDPASGAVTHNNLNSHIVNGEGDATLSRAFPQDLAFTQDGSTLYTVAQGSQKLVWYSESALESGTATPSATNQVTLSAGGPAGLVLDEARNRAYVLTRFDDGISTVDLAARTEVAHVQMFNPEPASVTAGRQYLYDATLTSKNGTQACASCHVGGDMDQLAWDLGNPDGAPLPITHLAQTITTIFSIDPAAIVALLPSTAPMFQANQFLKGPMTTQSLRGMDNHGAMHWRGDRNGAIQQSGVPFTDANGPIATAQPNAGLFDEARAFESFNVAFPGLLGRDTELSAEDMTAFRTFILQATYPPNPIRNLDDSLTPLEQAGASFFFNHAADGSQIPSDRFHNCNGCHVLDRNGNAGQTDHPGFFGTDGRLSFELEPQVFKVPHLRNMYEKIGMFGSSPDTNLLGTALPMVNPAFPELNPSVPAVRGFGYTHDGSVGTLEHFFTAQVFIQFPVGVPAVINGVVVGPNPGGVPFFKFDPTTKQIVGLETSGFSLRRAIVAFALAFDSNMRPVVGQQITLTASNASSANARIALLEARAAAGDCDLVVKGFIQGGEKGYVYSGGGFKSSNGTLTDAQLKALVGSKTDALTFTAVPPGSGWRIGLDRNSDGYTD